MDGRRHFPGVQTVLYLRSTLGYVKKKFDFLVNAIAHVTLADSFGKESSTLLKSIR